MDIREKFAESFGKDMEPEELLSLILGYTSVSKRNDSPAKDMIAAYGSLYRVLTQRKETLMSDFKISEHTAILISSILPAISYSHTHDVKSVCFDTAEKLGEYFKYKYLRYTYECINLLLLDEKLKAKECVAFFEGTINETGISLGKIAELAVGKKAKYMVIAHNHPEGTLVPSITDINTTRVIISMSESIGIPLVEHILVSDWDFVPIRLCMEPCIRNNNVIKYSNDIVRRADMIMNFGQTQPKTI